MFDEHFNPLPSIHRRGIIRWVLLALNAVPFAFLVFAYPQLAAEFPDMLDDNLARVAIPIWGALLVVHLLLVCLLEVRENVVYARRHRQRMKEFRERVRRRIRPDIVVEQ